jgi:hypothetical protein
MSRKRIKQYLMLLTVIGLIAVAANGVGTFASFSAQTTNKDNTFATGTLFLHNTADGTTCTSESNTSNGITTNPTGCDTLFKLSDGNIAAGDTKSKVLTLTNAGTVDAANLDVSLPSCTDSATIVATLNGAVTSGNAVGASISTSALTQALLANTPIKITDITTPANTQTFTVDSAGAAASATSIPVASAGNWSHDFDDKAPITINTNFGGTGLCGQLKISIAEDTTGASFSSGDTISCVYPSAGTYDSTTGCSGATALSTALTSEALGSTGLDAGASRYFKIFVNAPASLDNTAQNEEATFDLTWHVSET